MQIHTFSSPRGRPQESTICRTEEKTENYVEVAQKCALINLQRLVSQRSAADNHISGRIYA